MAIEENQMSWDEIREFARQNNWSHSEIEEYKKRHKCGEYRSEIGKDGKLIQHIRIIKLEINHCIGGVNHLLMHTPTSELMKHKLPGGKQSNVDRYTFARDDSSLWDSLTALREATEELCLHSPRIGVYLAHENRFVSYHLQTEEFITHDEISTFPSLILESKGYEENTVRSKGRYLGVEQSRTDVFVRGEIRSLSDLGFQTIEHGKEVFRWVPMTDDIVNFLYHMDKTRRKISRRYKNESSEFETSGSLPILPTHSMSVYDNRVVGGTKTTVDPENKQERDTNKHERVVKKATRNGMILDPSVPSRSAIRNEIKQQWSRRHKAGELRYRYYNKKRLDLISQFENLTLFLILKDKVEGEKSKQMFTRPLEKKERIQRGTQLLVGEFGLGADSKKEFTLGKNFDIFKQKTDNVRDDKQTQKQAYNQLVARYAYAFLTMNEIGCKNCGVSKGTPCKPEHLGLMSTGIKEMSLRIKYTNNGLPIYVPLTLAQSYNKVVKDTELENELLNLFKKVSKIKSLSWYSDFTIINPRYGGKLPKYMRPFVCDYRHREFNANTDQLGEILISLGIPLVMRSGIANLKSSRGSEFLFPTETEVSITQQNSLFLLLRRIQLRLFSSVTGVDEVKPGSDRVQRYENTRLILEFLKKGSVKLSTIPIDDLMTREQRTIDLQQLNFETHSKDIELRYKGIGVSSNDRALEVAYTLNQTEHTVQWSSLDPNRTYPVMSIESSFDEVLSAAFQHGEGVAISVDAWQIDGVDEYVQSKEDEAWRFGPDLFADDVKGARTFSSFLSTLVHHKMLDVKQKNVKQQRRILGVISLDELIRIRKILRKEDRFD